MFNIDRRTTNVDRSITNIFVAAEGQHGLDSGEGRGPLAVVQALSSLASLGSVVGAAVLALGGSTPVPALLAYAVAVLSGVATVVVNQSRKALLWVLIVLTCLAFAVGTWLSLSTSDSGQQTLNTRGAHGGFGAHLAAQMHRLKPDFARSIDLRALVRTAAKAGLFVGNPAAAALAVHTDDAVRSLLSENRASASDPAASRVDTATRGRARVQVVGRRASFTNIITGRPLRPSLNVTTQPGVGRSSDLPLRADILGRSAYVTDPTKAKVHRYHFNRRLRDPKPINMYGRPVAIRPAYGYIWVATTTGWINRIDPKTNRVKHLRVSHGELGPVVAPFGEVWVFNKTERCMARIDPAAWKVKSCVKGHLAGDLTAAEEYSYSVVVASPDADTVQQLNHEGHVVATAHYPDWAPRDLLRDAGKLFTLDTKGLTPLLVNPLN